MNNAPFYVGQKVVCVNAKSSIAVNHKASEVLEEGQIYIVKAVRKICCQWEIFLGHTTSISFGICPNCGHWEEESTEWFFLASRFAPIQESYEDITSEIAQSLKQTDERPDTVLIPETVNN